MTSFATQLFPLSSRRFGSMDPSIRPGGENAKAKWPGADLLFRLDQLLLPRLSGDGVMAY